MEDGKDGTPTFGLKALGAARTRWHELFKTKRRAVVTICAGSADALRKAIHEG